MTLGSGMMCFSASITGYVNKGSALALCETLVHGLGLHPAPGASISEYPLPDGRGGVGFTMFYPLTESYCVVDAYPDLKGAYIDLHSCVPFDKSKAMQLVSQCGFNIVDYYVRSLCLES